MSMLKVAKDTAAIGIRESSLRAQISVCINNHTNALRLT